MFTHKHYRAYLSAYSLTRGPGAIIGPLVVQAEEDTIMQACIAWGVRDAAGGREPTTFRELESIVEDMVKTGVGA